MSSTNRPKSLTVTQLTSRIKNRLNHEFSGVWVRGEVSGMMTARSGHLYFNLKDDNSQVSAMIWQSNAWRIQFDIKDGMEVVCLGNIDVYPPRGSYQLSVREIHEVGVGARQQALRRLHEKLKSLGWFDPVNKKPIPRFPTRVAVVTSPAGAAIRDFLQVVQRRWPNLEVIVVPASVQGDYAGAELAVAVRAANRIQPKLDAIVVTRGGGSAEDLWCFNDENLCQSIFESRVPVISGVGHEIDVSLCDLVADERALTPSEAAERLVCDQAQVKSQLHATDQRLKKSLIHRLDQARARLASLTSRNVLARPLDQLQQVAMNLDQLSDRIQRQTQQQLQSRQQALARVAAKLESLSPLGTLARGYSLTTADGKILRDSQQLEIGSLIETKLERGQITSRVESCE